MRTTQYYPVIQTADVPGTATFYRRHFGFAPLFEADWYVHLQSTSDPSVNLAILRHDHDTIPAEGRGPSRGVILNFEVADVDAQDARLRGEGLAPVQTLRSEPHGQRHVIFRDPNGVLIDVVTVIPPAAEHAGHYADGAAPT
ncbi:VOC family protein [Jannaschia sp. LMIT008]|uniref:VOC family protein n=1 Tax=Jannaschia maritima TaxID=3032585 RepID=UPI0028120D14|nr:VOC family protein [Jannaschia sp. LMIT008]